MSSAFSTLFSGTVGGEDVRGVLPELFAKFGSEELGMKFIATVGVGIGEISEGEFVGQVQVLASLSLGVILGVRGGLEEEVILPTFTQGLLAIP